MRSIGLKLLRSGKKLLLNGRRNTRGGREIRNRLILLNVFTLAGILSLFPLALLSLYNSDFLTALFLGSCALWLAAVYFFLWLRGFNTSLLYTVILPFVPLLLYDFLTNRLGGMGILGTLAFPPFIIFLLGHRRGMPMSALYLFLLTMAALALPAELIRYSRWQMILYLNFYLAVSFVSWLFDRVLAKNQRSLSHKNEKLHLALSNLKRTEDDLIYQAMHDIHTGLPNRRAYGEYVAREMTQWERMQRQGAIFCINIDRFKAINESMGAKIGDIVIIETASRIAGCLRRSDHLFRTAGNEFIVVLPHIRRDIDAGFVAEKIRKTATEIILVEGHRLSCTVRIGIAVYPRDSQEFVALLKYAQIALEHARVEGGNNYQFYNQEMKLRADHRNRIIHDLRQALFRDEMRLFYQPIVTPRGKIIGAEALLRWFHPTEGLIMPDQFIHLAEETGKIHTIGEWAMITACKQLSDWREMGLGDLFMSVNLSARQFRDQHLPDLIEHTINATRTNPDSLSIEITESCVMDDLGESLRVMTQFQKRGLRIAIDDFGTGYSSLSYLKNFPVNALKIDRAFVNNVIHDERDQILVKGIMQIARGLNIDIIVEGVETREQIDFFSGHNCQKMQGWFFSRAVAALEFEEMLRAETLISDRISSRAG